MNNKSIIEINNAEFGYTSKRGNKTLLSEINISAEKGENIALIGVNGSGKSTLLKTIAGSHYTLSGEINIEGKSVINYTSTELSKKLSIVTSEIISTKYLKVKDLVSLGRFPHQSFSKKLTNFDLQIINDSLKTTGILHLAEKNINEISDGERQKVMITRALVQDTNIILLDEPTAFLDIENKYSVYNILQKTATDKNKTIIFSTHDLNIALKHADKIWLIKDKTIYEGAPEDLILEDTFTKLFNNEEIFFNKTKIEFYVKLKKKYPIKLINNSDSVIYKQLTINALKRKHFYIDDASNNINIEILKENKWKIKTEKLNKTVSSIYKLLKILLEIKN